MEPRSDTITFLFTDVEGSTRLWEREAAAMAPALARHDDILRGSIENLTSRTYMFAPPFPANQRMLDADGMAV